MKMVRNLFSGDRLDFIFAASFFGNELLPESDLLSEPLPLADDEPLEDPEPDPLLPLDCVEECFLFLL